MQDDVESYMHGFYEDDEDSKPDMLLTKTGLYSKADIYLMEKTAI